MDFHKSFFDELEKIAIGRKSYRNPEEDPEGDEKHWNKRRKFSTALGWIAARKGRKLRTLAGGTIGGLLGGMAGQRLGPVGAVAGSALGAGAGSYLAHGKYDKKDAQHEYDKMNRK